jgi:UDPglucose--hexose-1-phosphate uridylyltransferase
MEAEMEAGHRIIYSDERVVMICPFWSGTPYEMLLLPRSHEIHLHDASGEDLAAMGRSVQLALASLRTRLGDVAYNLMFHSAPFRTKADFHWHVHVVPKISTRGGFEMGSGVLINVVPPERAAEDLRSELAAHA